MTDSSTTDKRVVPGTQIEILNEAIERGRVRFALFDFDGTISLIREGWPEVMIPMMVKIMAEMSLGDETEEEYEAVVREFVARLTGKQTIYQMIALCDAIKERGGTPKDPLDYKKLYLDLLWEQMKHRVEGLKDGSLKQVDFQVPGSVPLLENLKSRGVRMYLASGTDEPFVLDESETLGVSSYFDAIYGARDDYKAFSKAMVIERLIKENNLSGAEFLGFGDGYVEIENVKSVGGIAVAVATDEKECQTCDPWKHERLSRAGADLMIPSYREQEALMGYLFNDPS